MPQAIAIYAADYLLVAGIVNSAAAYAAVVAVVSTAVYAAGTYMLNKAAEAMAPDSKIGASQSYTVNYSGTAEPRRIIYGMVVCGGMHVAPPICTDKDGKAMHVIHALAGHECEDITDCWFDDELIPDGYIGAVTGTDNDGKVNAGKYKGIAWIRRYLGTATQNVDYILSQADPTVFDATFRGRGIAYVTTRLWQDSKGKNYPGGVPTILAKVYGKKILDTRTATTAWSDNPAMIVRDFLVNEVGFGSDQIDESLLNAAANACDQNVTIPGGASEKRYTCNVILEANDNWQDALKALIDTMHGRVVYRDGRWRIYAGVWDVPEFTINQGDWVSPVQVQASLSREERWNYVSAWYVDKDRRHTRMQCYPRSNATYETADAGERIPIELELPGVTGEYQAQRISELQLRKSRNQLRIAGRLRPEFIKLSTYDTVYITDDDFGWSLKTFRIVSMEMQPDGSVDIAAVEEGSAGYTDLLEAEYFAASTWNALDPSGGSGGPLIIDPFFQNEWKWWASASSGSAVVMAQSYIHHVDAGGSDAEGSVRFVAGGTPSYEFDRYIWSVRSPAYRYVTGQKFTVNIRWRRTSSLAVVNSYGGDAATLPILRPWLYASNENSLSAVGGNGYFASWASYLSAAQVQSAPINEWQTFETVIQPQSYYFPLPHLRAALESQIQYCNSGATVEVDGFDAYLGGGGVTFATTQDLLDGTDGTKAIAPDIARAVLDAFLGRGQHRAGKATAQCDLGNVSGTIVINCDSSNVFRVRLTGNAYLTTSNNLEGQFVSVRVKQNGTGGKVMSYAPYINIASGHAIASGPDKKSLIGMQWDEVDSEWNATIGKGW